MRKIHYLYLFMVFISIWMVESISLHIVNPEKAVPGGVVSILLLTEIDVNKIDSNIETFYNVALLNGDYIMVTNTNSFYLDTMKAHVALIGIPNTAQAGQYELKVKQNNEPVKSYDIEILPREFTVMEISLNRELTALRTDPRPEVSHQARAIHAIYNTFNHDRLFHFETLQIPLEYRRISAQYGDRRVYIYADGERSRSIHSGIDYAADIGTTVRAGGSGKVVLAEERIITGKSIVIAYLPGVYGIFFHLDTIAVKVDDIVNKETEIGTVGMTGLATGPHLHWEVRVSGVPVDPNIFVETPLLDKTQLLNIVDKSTE